MNNHNGLHGLYGCLRCWALSVSLLFTFSPLFAAQVETDRPWYLAGEAMEVSISDADALIAYAELCDTHGLAAGVVVGLEDGEGTGIIELPSHLHSGYYMLSVYTRDNAQVTQRLIAVVNPLQKSADDDITWVRITHPDSTGTASPSCVPIPADAPTRSLSVESDLRSSASPEGDTNVMLQSNEAPSGAVGGAVPVDERETEGHIIKARVGNVYGGQTYSGSQIRPSLSIIGKQVHYFEGRMVDDSTAVFYTYGIHGKLPLVLSAMTSTGQSLPIEMMSPFATLLPKQLPHLVFHYNRSEVEARSLDMQRHQIAIAPAKRELKLGEIADDTAEEGTLLPYDETIHGIHPDLSYNLDEYRQFLTIREVLLEYVKCVSKRRINGVQQLVVQTELDQHHKSVPPLVLIDGMPVVDVERLLSYDARRIHYINIYRDQFTFGNGVYSGILSFVTRSGRLTNYPTEPNVQYLVYSFPLTRARRAQ
jgi:hypothetical protein